MAQMAFAVSDSTHEAGYRYISAHACVFVEGSRRSVFVGGALVGSYDVGDKAMRNAILVKLSEDPKVHLGHLADAFELTQEQVRRLRRQYETNGLSGVTQIKHGGRARVVTPALHRKLYELFDAGASIDLAHTKIKARISRTIVGRTRKAWRLERELEASARAAVQTTESAAPAEGQLGFGAAPIQNVDAEFAPQTPVEVGLAAADDVLNVGAAATEIWAPLSSEAGLVGGSSLTLDGWRALMADPDSVTWTPTYPESTRSIEGYQQFLGGTATLEAFLAEARLQSRATWRPEYTARTVNAWVRAGFGMP